MSEHAGMIQIHAAGFRLLHWLTVGGSNVKRSEAMQQQKEDKEDCKLANMDINIAELFFFKTGFASFFCERIYIQYIY